MSAEQSLKYLERELECKLDEANKGLAEFRNRLEKEPAIAFEWGGNAMMYAAHHKVITQITTSLPRLKENYPEAGDVLRVLHKGLQTETLNAARMPKRSTSPIANVMDQEVGMAYAEWFNKVDHYIDE